jgi:hypothetical protein
MSDLVVVRRSPENHDDKQQQGEEQVPKSVVEPQSLPVFNAVVVCVIPARIVIPVKAPVYKN